MSIILYAPLLMHGVLVTLASWVIAMFGGTLIGACAGVAACHELRYVHVQWLVAGYSFVVKAVPAYVQILIAYFVIPAVLHIQLSGFIAATMALMICSSGYISGIVRAGIDGVPRGQWQAARVLGYSVRQALHRIILPQAVQLVRNPLMGEYEQLLKSTSLLATIGVLELTRVGMNIISRELNPLPVYLCIALIYVLLSALFQVAVRRLQVRRSYVAD